MSQVILSFNLEDAWLDLQPQPLALPEPYRSKIVKHWDHVNHDGRFFNGKVLTATGLNLTSSTPVITLAVTDYAHYLYAKHDHTHEVDCRAVYCAALLFTSDNHLLLGQMSAHTSSPGQIQCPGGGIEIGRDNGIDPRSCCRRELEEEIGAAFLKGGPVFQTICIKSGGDLETIGLFYALRLTCDARGALEIFTHHQTELRSAGEKPEFDRLHALEFSRGSIADFVTTQGDILVDYLRPLLKDRREDLRIALEKGGGTKTVPAGTRPLSTRQLRPI
jgi:8-oxo-dGTP pyrophosphatase MutT (NUDIX family)